jgi:hypothetical protein
MMRHVNDARISGSGPTCVAVEDSPLALSSWATGRSWLELGAGTPATST